MITTKIISVLTKKRFLFFVLVFVSLLSIYYLYQYANRSTETPQTTPSIPPTYLTPQRKDLPKIEAVKYTSGLKFPSLPSTMSVYQGETAPENILNLSQKFITSLQLVPYPNVSNAWTTSDGSANLTLNVTQKTVTYKVNGSKNPTAYSNSIVPQKTKALEVAAKFISDLNLNTEYLPQLSNISYFKVTGSEFISSSEQHYNLIEIPFAQSIDGFPVIFGTNFIFPIQILIGNNYTIVRAIVTSQPITFSQTSSKDHGSVSESQVKDLIAKGQFQIIDAYSPQPIPVLPSQIPDITIDKVEIQYRLNDKEGLIIPYFVLTDSTSKINVTILVPAVSLD